MELIIFVVRLKDRPSPPHWRSRAGSTMCVNAGNKLGQDRWKPTKILCKHLNRKVGFLIYATDPAPPKRIEEMEKEGWRSRGTLTVSPEFLIDASLESLVTNGFGVLQGMNFLYY